MARKRRLMLSVFAVLIIMIAAALDEIPYLLPEAKRSGGSVQAVVESVVDGDTIDVSIGGRIERVRYIGIDTPESVHPDEPPECFGKEAALKNSELVSGKAVRLERDIRDRDAYGRLLRYVYVGDVFVNSELVRQGYAHAATFPPDVRHSEDFVRLERQAKLEGRGLWSGCSQPRDFPDVTQLAPDPACAIKGNISFSGERIFHIPGCEYYDKTRIEESKGEKWFCTESDAASAGWRKALNCP